MRRHVRWLAALATAVALAPAAGAQQLDALKLVPADAPAFGYVQRLGEAIGRIEEVGKKVSPLPVSLRDLLKQELGIDKGVDEKGDLVVVIYGGPMGLGEGEQVNVIAVPVTDYKEFAESLKAKDAGGGVTEVTLADGSTLRAARKGRHALLARPEHADALKKVLDAKNDVTGSLKELRGWLGETTFALVLNPEGVKAAFAEWGKGLEKLKEVAGGLPPEAQAAFGWTEGAADFLKRAEKEVTQLALGARLDAKGDMVMRLRAAFAPGGTFAKAGGQAKVPAGDPLAGLPAGPYALAFGGVFRPETIQGTVAFNVQMIKATTKDLTDEQVRRIESAFKDMYHGMEGLSLRIGPGKEGTSFLGDTVGVMRVKSAKEFFARYQKAAGELRELAAKINNPLAVPAFEVTEVKAAGKPGLKVVVDLSKGEGLPPEAKKAMEAMFGPGGKMVATMAAADERTVIIGYFGPEQLPGAFAKAPGKGLGGDAEVAKVTALLPKGSQWVVLVHLKGTLDLVRRLASDIAGQAVPLPELPDGPPLGLGARFAAAGLDVDLVMPAALIDAAGRFQRKALEDR